MPRLAVFLDDGGVMNDNETRSLQWQNLVAEYLAPKLGGNPDDWGEATRIVAELEFKMYNEHPWQRPDAEHLKFRERVYEDWLSRMCEQVGVDAPAGEECVKMARETNEFVTRRVRSACPGAVEAIRTLHSAGHQLYTASGEDSTLVSCLTKQWSWTTLVECSGGPKRSVRKSYWFQLTSLPSMNWTPS